jgi:hypothetical protein
MGEREGLLFDFTGLSSAGEAADSDDNSAGAVLPVSDADIDEILAQFNDQQGAESQGSSPDQNSFQQMAGISMVQTAPSPPPPAAGGPAVSGVDQSLTSAVALEADNLPEAIDPSLPLNKTYLIFKPFDKDRLEFSLYTSDGTQYNRYDPVVSGQSTRVPPGLIYTENLEANTVYPVSRYLKMFGLALENKRVVPEPKETPPEPFAVKVTNVVSEVYDRLILARLCGPQISKPLFWKRLQRTRMDQFQLFNANIGFVEWAMLPYNQKYDIKQLLAVWRGTESLGLMHFIEAQPDRHEPFVFDINESGLEDAYGFGDVKLVTTILKQRPVPPAAGSLKRQRKNDGPAAPPAPGGPAPQRTDNGALFTENREPVAAQAAATPQPRQGDQTDSQFFAELFQEIDGGQGPGS